MRIIITILLVGIAASVAIHSALMRKIIAILFVGIALIELLTPRVKWDGFEHRDVKISVMTASQTPVPGARVVFRDRYDLIRRDGDDYAQMTSEERQEWMDVHCPSGVTDAEGAFVFRALFPASGSKFLFWYTGGFGLRGRSRSTPMGTRRSNGHYASLQDEAACRFAAIARSPSLLNARSKHWTRNPH